MVTDPTMESRPSESRNDGGVTLSITLYYGEQEHTILKNAIAFYSSCVSIIDRSWYASTFDFVLSAKSHSMKRHRFPLSVGSTSASSW